MNRHTIGINIMFIETASSPYEKAKIRAGKETIREERRKEKKRKKILIAAVYTIDIGVTTQMQLLKYEMNHLFHVKHI